MIGHGLMSLFKVVTLTTDLELPQWMDLFVGRAQAVILIFSYSVT